MLHYYEKFYLTNSTSHFLMGKCIVRREDSEETPDSGDTYLAKGEFFLGNSMHFRLKPNN